MKVLITGAGGFIGSHLVEQQLALGREVRGVDLDLAALASLADHPRLALVEGDITDETLRQELCDGIEIVFHLASAHLDVTLGEDIYRAVNVEAARGLAAAAHRAGVGRFLHVSTNGVVGIIDDPPVDETVLCRPTNLYERTKLEGERAVLDYGRESGLPVVVIRPAWVYGPRCPRTAKLLRSIRKGRFVMFGSGRTLRHPIFVEDFLAGLELAAWAEEAPGEIFFIAGESAMPIGELARAMAAVLGVRPPGLRLPLWLGQLAGGAAELAFRPLGRRPPISRRTLDFFTKDNAYEIGKARRLLGFTPRIPLEEGLRRTLAAGEENQRDSVRIKSDER